MWIFGNDYSARAKRRRFFRRFRLSLFVASGLVLMPLASYIAGRIALPEMGLTPPSYSVWFAVFLVYLTALSIFKGIQYTLGYGTD